MTNAVRPEAPRPKVEARFAAQFGGWMVEVELNGRPTMSLASAGARMLASDVAAGGEFDLAEALLSAAKVCDAKGAGKK